MPPRGGWGADVFGAASTSELASLVGSGLFDALVVFASSARSRAALQPVVDDVAPACAVAGVALAFAGRVWPVADPPRGASILSPAEVGAWVRGLRRPGDPPAASLDGLRRDVTKPR